MSSAFSVCVCVRVKKVKEAAPKTVENKNIKLRNAKEMKRWAGEGEGEMKDCRGKQKTTGNAKYHSEHNRRFMSGRLLSHGVEKKTINRTGGNV